MSEKKKSVQKNTKHKAKSSKKKVSLNSNNKQKKYSKTKNNNTKKKTNNRKKSNKTLESVNLVKAKQIEEVKETTIEEKINIAENNIKTKNTTKEIEKIEDSDIEAKKDKLKNNIKFLKSFLFTMIILALIYGISLLLSYYVIPTVKIYDNSMLPGLNDDNIIMLLKTNKVKKGDVVAVYVDDKMLIKRCVATEKDIVNIDADGNLFVNDKKIEENYLLEKSYSPVSIDFPYTVPENHIFILSDDRTTQSDSRNSLIGSIDKKNIYGKALIKVYPIKDIGVVK